MAITDHKISQAEIDARNCKRLGATSTGTADEVQELIDKLPEYAITKHNALIDELLTSLYMGSTATAPSSATDTGTAGEIRIGASYIYICTATDTWKRISLSW